MCIELTERERRKIIYNMTRTEVLIFFSIFLFFEIKLTNYFGAKEKKTNHFLVIIIIIIIYQTENNSEKKIEIIMTK